MRAIALAAVVLAAGCGTDRPAERPAGEGPPPAAFPAAPKAERFAAPPGWQVEKPSSSMRLAQFRIPRADGDAADGEVQVFHFPGGGGGTQANIDRWRGQVSEVETEKVEEWTEGLKGKATVLDISGRFVAETRPGSGDRRNEPGWRMIAAVIEVPGGPYFVKAVGPRGTIGKWEESIREFLRAAAR